MNYIGQIPHIHLINRLLYSEKVFFVGLNIAKKYIYYKYGLFPFRLYIQFSWSSLNIYLSTTLYWFHNMYMRMLRELIINITVQSHWTGWIPITTLYWLHSAKHFIAFDFILEFTSIWRKIPYYPSNRSAIYHSHSVRCEIHSPHTTHFVG